MVIRPRFYDGFIRSSDTGASFDAMKDPCSTATPSCLGTSFEYPLRACVKNRMRRESYLNAVLIALFSALIVTLRIGQNGF